MEMNEVEKIFWFCASFSWGKKKNSNSLVKRSSEVSVRQPNENVSDLIKILFIFTTYT